MHAENGKDNEIERTFLNLLMKSEKVLGKKLALPVIFEHCGLCSFQEFSPRDGCQPIHLKCRKLRLSLVTD